MEMSQSKPLVANRFLLAVNGATELRLYCNCPFRLIFGAGSQVIPLVALSRVRLTKGAEFLNHIRLKSGLIFLLKKVGTYSIKAV